MPMCFRGIVLLVLIVTTVSIPLIGCSPEVADTGQSDMEQAVKVWQESLKTEKLPAHLFPTATRVLAYAGRLGLTIDENGNATTSNPQPDGNFLKVRANGGEPLDPAEIETLRNSIFYAPQPPGVAAFQDTVSFFLILPENTLAI